MKSLEARIPPLIFLASMASLAFEVLLTRVFSITMLTYLCLALPFFCTGLVIATAFSVKNQRAGQFYGADMVGAGIGSLGILLLMRSVPPEQGIFVISLAVVAAACMVGDRRFAREKLFDLGWLSGATAEDPLPCRFQTARSGGAGTYSVGLDRQRRFFGAGPAPGGHDLHVRRFRGGCSCWALPPICWLF